MNIMDGLRSKKIYLIAFVNHQSAKDWWFFLLFLKQTY
jgi:hypothetical protein